MPRTFPPIFLNNPLLELSDEMPISRDIGIEQFEMGDNYASAEKKPANQNRFKTTWIWKAITIEQFWALEAYFMGLGTDYILWTPEGYPTELKWRPLPGDLKGAFSGFDNTQLAIKVAQAFDNG